MLNPDLTQALQDFGTNSDPFSDQKKVTVEKDPKKSGLEDMPDSALSRYVEQHQKLIANLAEIGLPKKGQQFRLVTRRTFNAIQFLEYIAAREKITALKIAIYSINYAAADILIKLIDGGKIEKAEILMSNLRNAAHREKEVIIKNRMINHPAIDLFFCSSHAKVFSCQTENENYYTVEGSGNLAYNSRIEQYVIDNDKTLFDFTCRWFRDIREHIKNKKEYQLT
jgi:hypothetical protein